MNKIFVVAIIISLVSTIAIAGVDTDKWILRQMQKYNIPGCSISVIKNYQISQVKTYGVRNKAKNEPVTVNTVFQAASMSKPVAAVAAVSAFKKNNLSLDKNVNDILVNWKIPASNYLNDHPVTMRLLLAHAAGITGFRYRGYATNDKLPTLLQSLQGVAPANTPPVVMVRMPGEKYEYCPAGYTIIQQVLEDIYKESFAQVMKVLILNPLKMQHSTFEAPLSQKWLSDIALPYLPDGKVMPNGPLTFIASAAGGMWSTPSDIAKFVIAVQETLRGNHPLGIDAKTMRIILTPVRDHNMGLGFEVNINKYGEQSKTTADYFRHGGFNSGYISMFVGSKHNGNGVVVMVNAAPYMNASSVPQYDFIAKVIKHIAIEEGWNASSRSERGDPESKSVKAMD